MDIIKLKNDVNGNPRQAVHFLDFLKSDQSETVEQALLNAKLIFGFATKYRGKDMGGMIVISEYLSDGQITDKINNFINL